jgi:antitoxin VapB
MNDALIFRAKSICKMYIPLVCTAVTSYLQTMTKSTVFMTNKTQAVRLPKAVALPAGVRTVEVVKVGNARLVTPADGVWDTFFDASPASDDFLTDREQPPIHMRDPL